MKRINSIVDEMHFKNRNEVRVYYRQEDLAEIAESHILDKTGINVNVKVHMCDIAAYGYYLLDIEGFDNLPDEDREAISSHFDNPIESLSEFTVMLTSRMFLGCGEGGDSPEHIHTSKDFHEIHLPVSFTKDSYQDFIEKMKNNQ